MESSLSPLVASLSLGSLLELLRSEYGGYELLDHWQQGEFHHDVLVRAGDPERLPGVLVIATNCNGGVKEVLAFEESPERDALWHFRCPEAPEFSGKLPKVLGREITTHWFDPGELLAVDARSELRPEFRTRQRGGGWCAR